MPIEHVEQPGLPSDAHDLGYRPSNADKWTDPDPVSVGQALDDLAATAVTAKEVYVPLLAVGSEVSF